ncbi:MAG: glycosyltransferase, partial [Gammaproteobacteria bacterium]
MATRYCYLKNGDAIEQLAELDAAGWIVPEGGPNAFLADFLAYAGDNPLLLLSGVARKHRRLLKQVEAVSFVWEPVNAVLARKAVTRLVAAAEVSIRMLRYRPQVILCGRAGLMLLLSLLVGRLYGAPVIHARHNQFFPEQAVPFRRRLALAVNKWVLGRVDGIICHGPYLKDQLLGAGVRPERIHEFDSSFGDFAAAAGESDVTNSSLWDNRNDVILYVGRIEIKKGVMDLLRASSHLLREGGPYLLVYAGSGFAMDVLAKEVEVLGLK